MPVATMTAETLRPAERPTFYFIGVSTGSSSIQRVFPAWAEELGLEAGFQGIDLPLHAPAEQYRRVVEFLRDDPASMGALVTTHKIDLFVAAHDLFDECDYFSLLMGETSCLSKRDDRYWCHAKDPISAGLSLDSFIPTGYWTTHPMAAAAILGAGGSAIAIAWHLSRMVKRDDRPSRIITTNRSGPRLDHARDVHQHMDTDTVFEYVLSPTPAGNDEVVSALPVGSLVINATGLGKDAPGSPLTDGAQFPQQGLVWELNYRGDLVFLDQARAQQAGKALTVEDGWVYFLHGWTQAISEVFHIDIPTAGPAFDRLSDIARAVR